MGWLAIPNVWQMAQPTREIRDQAAKAFNSKIVSLSAWAQPIPFWSDLKHAQGCAGLIIIRSPASHIPAPCAQVIDFFFGRDKNEALVYEYQPFEKTFRLVDRDWLNLRRAV